VSHSGSGTSISLSGPTSLALPRWLLALRSRLFHHAGVWVLDVRPVFEEAAMLIVLTMVERGYFAMGEVLDSGATITKVNYDLAS